MAGFGLGRRRSTQGPGSDPLGEGPDDERGSRRRSPGPWSTAPLDPDASPMRMQGREPLWGYGAAVLLGAGALANLLDTTGKGALAHPVLWPSWLGLVLAVGLAGSIQLRNRLLSPLAAIFSAFFLTLERGPDSLSYIHILVLVGAVGFAVALTMRQRRQQRALGPARGRSGRGGARGGATARGAAGDAERPRKPPPSRRYTPPKKPTPSTSSRRSRTTRR